MIALPIFTAILGFIVVIYQIYKLGEGRGKILGHIQAEERTVEHLTLIFNRMGQLTTLKDKGLTFELYLGEKRLNIFLKDEIK